MTSTLTHHKNNRPLVIDQSAYLEKIIAQMVNYSQLNFEESLDILDYPEMDELVPGLAVGVNILGEELQHKVNELKNLNTELENRDSFIRSVTNTIPETIYVYNLTTERITYVNKCTSYKPDYPCPVIIMNKSVPCHNCRVTELFAKMKKEHVIEITRADELRIASSDHKARWYKTTSNAFEKDENGNVVSILQTLSDITLLKEKEMQLLKKEETIIQSLKEKELLLQEVHHRVKNNLQIITGLLTLQINRAKSHEVISQLTEIRSRILSISLIHEELYQSETLARIDVSKYCIRLCTNLAPVYSNGNTEVSFDFDIEPGILWSIDKATPLGLIINEVICNSYKHAFSNQPKGLIQVRLKSTESHYIMELKDNGKTQAMPDAEHHGKKTLGSKLINGLIMQLEASMKISTDGGYGVTLTIPKEL